MLPSAGDRRREDVVVGGGCTAVVRGEVMAWPAWAWQVVLGCCMGRQWERGAVVGCGWGQRRRCARRRGEEGEAGRSGAE